MFVLQGHGLIVTGTALSGTVRVGDRVRCLPGDQLFRVRSLQVHNQSVETASWGQRVAINLTAQDKPAIERGHVICDEAITQTSERFDAWMEVRPTAVLGIKTEQRVRVHLGTAERLGKVVLLGSEKKLAPKASAYCQVVLTEPLPALRGDHFIIRDETAQATLGGGIVIHPWARRHKRSDPALGPRLAALHTGEFGAVVEAFLTESDDFAVPIGLLQQFLNLRKEEVEARVDKLPTVHVFSFEGEKLYASQTKWREFEAHTRQQLKDFHAAHPMVAGMEMEELREKSGYQIGPRVFRAFLDQLEAEGVVATPTCCVCRKDPAPRRGTDARRSCDLAIERGPLAPPRSSSSKRSSASRIRS